MQEVQNTHIGLRHRLSPGESASRAQLFKSYSRRHKHKCSRVPVVQHPPWYSQPGYRSVKDQHARLPQQKSTYARDNALRKAESLLFLNNHSSFSEFYFPSFLVSRFIYIGSRYRFSVTLFVFEPKLGGAAPFGWTVRE